MHALRRQRLLGLCCQCVRTQWQVPLRTKRSKHRSDEISSLFVPVLVKPNPDDINVGVELSEKLRKQDLQRVLVQFHQREEVKSLCLENGLDNTLYHQAYISFRRYCLESEVLPPELHIVFSDILQNAGHVDDIFPYFMAHAQKIFPHLECMDDLKKISDLRSPTNWYPEARALNRKIFFHAGPTNSGKTYQALERFLQAKSGVYCGPLKLLAVEVFQKANQQGTPCDLVTGEERRYADPKGETQALHLACTVEMTSVSQPYEVAVIDEIQMMRDPERGWAWTRALLGVAAEEVHVCGEASAIQLVQDMCSTADETLEVRKYKRLTELEIESKALRSLDNVQPGDCIVCFSKNDIYAISRSLESKGHQVAVIYGGLPPGTKLAQAQKFNDPEDPCKILVATDAVGMGLNLSIRRIIFYSIIKPTINEKGEKEMDILSTSQALQIAGRAGRYATQHEKGYVTTFKAEDLPTLKALLAQQPEPLTQAGLHPTAEQIELYAYHLPNATLSNLMDIFMSLSTVDDSLFFMCNIEQLKFLADMIQHVPLPLRARYVFCCAPINRKMPFVCTMFLKYARQYSRNEPVTLDWLCHHLGWPFAPPRTILDLVHLESVFDVLDLYLWLSYRFSDLFPDALLVRDMQKELDDVIQQGVVNITKLLKNSETGISGATGLGDAQDAFTLKIKQQQYKKGKTAAAPESATAKTMGLKSRGGELAQRLVDQGLLTPKMLQQLQEEWLKSSQNDPPSSPNSKKKTK